MAYSSDLRKRVIQYVENGHSNKEAAAIYRVGVSTVYLWMKTPKRVTTLAMGPKTASKLDRNRLQAFVKKRPDAYLAEIAHEFKVASSTVYYALRGLNLSRKKNGALPRAKRKKAC
jgi:transposase